MDHNRQLVHQGRRAKVWDERRRRTARFGDPVRQRLDQREDRRGVRKGVVEWQLTPPLDDALQLDADLFGDRRWRGGRHAQLRMRASSRRISRYSQTRVTISPWASSQEYFSGSWAATARSTESKSIANE